MEYKLENIPIVCVNRFDRKDRWERMEKRFKSHNLKVKRWEASTPKDVEKCELPIVNYLKPTQKACTLSHLGIYKYMVENDIEVMFILEDDAAFRKDWKPILERRLKYIDDLDSEWDALFLNVTEELSKNDVWLPCINQCLTGGYIIRKHAAEFILNIKNSHRAYYASDWMTQILQNRKHSYTYFPWLIIQEGSYSDIQGLEEGPDYAKVLRLLKAVDYSIENYDI